MSMQHLWSARTAGLVVAVVLFFEAVAFADYPASVEPYVNDFANVIAISDESVIREGLTQLRTDHGIEMTVVTVDSIRDYGTGDSTIEAFATNLFNNWGIGERDSNNGALLLIAVNDRELRIEVGSAYGKTLDQTAQRIIEYTIIPAFKRKNMSGGIRAGADELANTLVAWRPENLEAPVSGGTTPNPTAPPPQAEANPFVDPQLIEAQKQLSANANAARDRALIEAMRQKQLRAKEHANGLTSMFTLGGVIAAVLGLLGVGAKFATAKPRCPGCKRVMHLQDPSKDYQNLDSGQQTEEKLHSVDYQFWYCPACNQQTMREKRSWFTRASKCPQCNYRTVLQNSRVVSSPTRYSTGLKEVEHTCEHCSYHFIEQVILPCLPEPTDHTHGGGFGGGSGFGGGGGSSSSGGSSHFGGGSSSGGGASGKW